MPKEIKIGFKDLSPSKKNFVEVELNPSTNNPEQNLKTLRGDLLGNLQLGEAKLPTDEEERAAWISKITGHTPLADPIEEEARQIAMAIAPTYSQNHAYIIAHTASIPATDKITATHFQTVVPYSTATKKYYRNSQGDIIFLHQATNVNIKSNYSDDVTIYPNMVLATDHNILDCSLGVTFNTKNPKATLQITVNTHSEEDNALVKNIITQKNPNLLGGIKRSFAKKYHAEALERYDAERNLTAIDEYISHLKTAKYEDEYRPQKLEIALTAKAELTGNIISDEGLGDGITYYIYSNTNSNDPLEKKNQAFNNVLEKKDNKSTLLNSPHNKYLTAIVRLFKKLKMLFPINKEVTQPLLRVGFYKSHAEALLTATNIPKSTVTPNKAGG